MDIMDDEDDSNAPSADQDDSFCPGSYGNEVDWWSLGITLYEVHVSTNQLLSSSDTHTNAALD